MYSLNRFYFHVYFVEIFALLALKENFSSLTLCLLEIINLSAILPAFDYEENILIIRDQLLFRIEEIDKGSAINILKIIINNKTKVDFSELFLKVDNIICTEIIKNDDQEELYIFKYLYYLSKLDTNFLKKIPNFPNYFEIAVKMMSQKVGIEQMSALNLLMVKLDTPNEKLFEKMFPHLKIRLPVKIPDEYVKASMKLIRKFKGQEGLSEISKRVREK
jgi:hypothetical protein